MTGKINSSLIMVLAGLLIISGLVVWLVLDGGDAEESGTTREVLTSRRIVDNGGKSKQSAKRKRPPKRNASAARVPVARNQDRPDFKLEAEDEAKLTAEMKKLYQDLQLALDSNNRREVINIVRKLQAMDEWPDGIPRAVKLQALDALSWFGAAGLTEAVGFLGDADSEVVDSAVEKFSDMLSDFSLGDRSKAEILKQVITVVHDHDTLDTFLMEMNNMRNSVRADMAIAIFDSGNSDAVAVLDENIDFFFSDNEGDYEVKTRDDVQKYVKDNPDGEDDDDFYGPS